jgi:ABC-2 type transport system permease protein
MRAFWAGYRLQTRAFRAYPDSLFPLFMTPFLALIFLMIMDHAGREDLAPYAVVAPVFMALWWVSVTTAGGLISWDRWQGMLELLVAAPASFPLVVFGRILAVTTIGLVGFVEVWLIAKVLYPVEFVVRHPLEFAVTLVVSAAAMAATAVALASLFVLARNAITFVNSASYPFFVLGGVLVPISFLPDWIEPLSSAVFLSWSAGLLRSALEPEPVDAFGFRVGMVLAIGAVGLLVGAAAMTYFLKRVRGKGELGLQ